MVMLFKQKIHKNNEWAEEKVHTIDKLESLIQKLISTIC
jgi:hypothetical protein